MIHNCSNHNHGDAPLYAIAIMGIVYILLCVYLKSKEN